MTDSESEIVEHHADELFEHDQKPGDTFFALIFAIAVIFLLSQIGEQTKWVNGVDTMMQPRMWPLVALIGMALFGLAYLFHSFQALKRHPGLKLLQIDEVVTWVRPIEYACYFLIYVYVVPILGYLLSTIIFCLFLCLRAGYRQAKTLLMSAIVAVTIVLFFKTFLQVKIPGGQIYGWFPDNIRNFLISYF
jgi:hypothetical protein